MYVRLKHYRLPVFQQYKKEKCVFLLVSLYKLYDTGFVVSIKGVLKINIVKPFPGSTLNVHLIW